MDEAFADIVHPCRADVRAMLRESFPALEAANDKDMRWKKFLYRRTCGWAGFSA